MGSRGRVERLFDLIADHSRLDGFLSMPLLKYVPRNELSNKT